VLSNCLPRDFDSKVNSWRYVQTEGFGDGTKVKRIDVEYVTLVMRCVSLEVGSVPVFGCAVQVIVLLYQFLELVLDVGKFVFWEFILVWRDFRLFQISQECELMLIDEEKSTSGSTCSSGCSSYSMNIIFWIIWRIKLYNPINVWEI